MTVMNADPDDIESHGNNDKQEGSDNAMQQIEQ
jgi:hypothetical protein